MSTLPEGWALATVGSLIELNPKTDAPDDAEAGFSPMPMLGTNYRDEVGFETRRWGEIRKSYVHFQDGDVLLAKITPCFENGKAGLVRGMPSGIGAGSSEYLVCRTNTEGLDPRYLLAFLKTEEFLSGGEPRMTGSVGHKRVPKDYLLETELPLAPRPEQLRIADKLDELLARVDSCRGRLDRVPAILKRLRKAVLFAATNGQLTVEWREEAELPANAAASEVLRSVDARRKTAPPGKKFKEPVKPDLAHWNGHVPESWTVESVSAFAECLDHLRVPVTKAQRSSAQGLYPYYGANGEVDRVDEYLFDDELVLVTEDETFYGREKPIAYRSTGRCWVNNHAHVLSCGSKLRADYLCIALMHYDVLPWLTGTTGRAKLTQGALNALPIAVPPESEMAEIVRRVESLFALADAIEAKWKTARTQVERLTPALLAKAFRGELVPQDPNDEPASALLTRIQAERAATPISKPRGRRAATSIT